MENRARFKKIMNFENADRLPMVEWANWWDKTLERWYTEGLDRNLTDGGAIQKYFGLDMFRQMWISPRARLPKYDRPKGCVRDKESYEFIKSFFDPVKSIDLDRLSQWAEHQRRGEIVIWLTLDGFYWIGRELFGIEAHNYAFYDKPELVHRINHDLVEFNLAVLRRVSEICRPDFMTFAEDMSYNHGPMISRRLFDEFLLPYYRQIVPELKANGIIPIVDSDGNITELMDWLMDAGIEGVLPLERQAGVDIVEFRRRYPKAKIIGGFDKTVMSRGVEGMRQEFERILPVMSQGGYIPGVDHQTPPDVSLEMYKAYLQLLREYCVKAVK